ncbi:flagellin [Clostridium sp. 1001271st1 H5]|uniref:flagellin N-terminal helical domain-containing protein n=1 Tax=unclassified Clostridium TaxID=2614128 RepID=UPI00325AC305
MEVISMRIQHNIMALNSNRQLGVNNSAVSKSLEKLSSGYRINRAGDDAAGLAISEKMRAQIKGLEAATDNSQDAISLVQTAEGGLQEVHSMLNRMTELATKSANGTYTDDVDRKALQDEVSALKDEINRIADGTDFNGIKLLDGTMGVGTSGVSGKVDLSAGNVDEFKATISGAGENTTVDFKTAAGAAGVKANWAGGKLTVTISGDTGDKITQEQLNQALAAATGTPETAKNIKIELDEDISITGTTDASGSATLITAKAAQATSADTGASGISISSTKAGENTHTLTTKTTGTIGATVDVDGNVALNLTSTKSYTATEINKMLSDAGSDIRMDFEGAKTGTEISGAKSGGTANVLKLGENGKAGTGLAAGGGMKLQIGDTSDSYNQLELSIADMHVNALDLNSVDISTRDGAAAAMSKIKTAINTVSTSRGKLGAIQNRLEHTINNLGVTTENITSAESRIRDVDMAKEMMNYTKNSVLVQSAQAMLAQANQQPQSVLQLLQ